MGLEPSMYNLRSWHSATRPTRHIVDILLIVTYYKLLSKMCLACFLTRSYGKMPLCALRIPLKQIISSPIHLAILPI